jgi:hypothetical protein
MFLSNEESEPVLTSAIGGRLGGFLGAIGRGWRQVFSSRYHFDICSAYDVEIKIGYRSFSSERPESRLVKLHPLGRVLIY